VCEYASRGIFVLKVKSVSSLAHSSLYTLLSFFREGIDKKFENLALLSCRLDFDDRPARFR
jgi:hypothetical protein